MERTIHRYGGDDSQVVELFEPAGASRGVAVVIHGGFWRAAYDRPLMDELCADLAAASWVAWNVEYRRVGAGGGWPDTFLDVAAAVDALASATLDLGVVVTIGHSAGGHLAFWAAARPRLPAGAPGADPAVRVTHAVAQAGVVDLEAAARLGLGRRAAEELLDVPHADDPERWRLASPAALLPLAVPQLLVHGKHDDLVPASMSREYAAAAAAAGDEARAVVIDGAGHFEHLDPASALWRAVREWLPG